MAGSAWSGSPGRPTIGPPPRSDTICILDAGNNGIVFKADHVVAHGKYANGHEPSAHLMAGPHAHWAKVAFERMFLNTRKRGLVVL